MEIIIQLPRDINKLCRTCMNFTDDQSDSFENYIVQNNRLTELSKMLGNLTSLNIFPNDGLPETLCSQCVEQLQMAYTFKLQCTSIAANLTKLITGSELPDTEGKAEIMEESDYSSQLSLTEHDAVEQKLQEIIFTCQDCQETFTSYYDLSMHTIDHNANKTLSQRFLCNQDVDLKSVSSNVAKCHDTNNESVIKERKLHNSKSFKMETNQDFEIWEEQSKTDKRIAVKCSNARDATKQKRTPKISNKNVEVRCKICAQEFKSRKEHISHLCRPLNQHEETNSSKNKSLTKCTLCEKDFPDTAALSVHFLKHTLATENISNKSIESEFFFCEMCGQTFETSLLLHNHYNDKHEGKPVWTCPKCSEVFEKERDLLKHLNIHQKEVEDCRDDSVPCVLCNQTFSSKKALLVHSRAHLMKKYSCKKCSASFCTQQSYFAHLKSHPGYQYTCPTCGKHLSTKSALKSHIVGVHSVELRHTCATCGKSFATHSRLKTHSLIHTSHKKYVCSYCGYSAHKVGDLQIHTRTHTSERPYKCTFAQCPMSFKTSSHLCDHVRRHLKIRKFKCTICSMGFTTNHGLKIHQMQHTGEKPHSCIVCHQKFRRKYHVKVHMKQHNPSYS